MRTRKKRPLTLRQGRIAGAYTAQCARADAVRRSYGILRASVLSRKTASFLSLMTAYLFLSATRCNIASCPRCRIRRRFHCSYAEKSLCLASNVTVHGKCLTLIGRNRRLVIASPSPASALLFIAYAELYYAYDEEREHYLSVACSRRPFRAYFALNAAYF